MLARAVNAGASTAGAAEKATFAGGCFWGVELGTPGVVNFRTGNLKLETLQGYLAHQKHPPPRTLQ